MYINEEIAKDTFYVGVNDRLKAKFENIGYFKFNIDDCMRSDIVKTVLRAYS